jgi:hypothetical protein
MKFEIFTAKGEILEKNFREANDTLLNQYKGVAQFIWEKVGEGHFIVSFGMPVSIPFLEKLLGGELKKQIRKIDPHAEIKEIGD